MSDIGYRGGYKPFFKAVAELSARGVFNSSEVSVEVLSTSSKEATHLSEASTDINYFEKDEMEIQFKQGSYIGSYLHKITNSTAIVAFSKEEEVYSERFNFKGEVPDSGGLSLSTFIMTDTGVGLYVGQLEEKETREVRTYYGIVFRGDFPDDRCPICNSAAKESGEGEAAIPSDAGCGSTAELARKSEDERPVGRSGFRFRNFGSKDFRRPRMESGGDRNGPRQRGRLFRSFKKD